MKQLMLGSFRTPTLSDRYIQAWRHSPKVKRKIMRRFDRLLAWAGKTPKDIEALAEWAAQNQIDFTITHTRRPDDISAVEINTVRL
jgi:hypothetical protein